MATELHSRRLLFRWAGWFAVANVAVLSLVSLRYLSGLGAHQPGIVWLYLLTNFIAHHGLIALMVVMPLLTPVILVYPRKRVVLSLGVLAISLAIAMLTLDSLVFSQSRFHLNLFTIRILGSSSWFFCAVMLLIGLMFEAMLAGSVWRWVSASKQRKGLFMGSMLGVCLLISQGIYAWADASYFVPVNATANRIPLFRGVTAKSFFNKTGLVDIKQSRERSVARSMTRDLEALDSSGLHYPLSPLRCEQQEKSNLLLIVVDSMRSDMVTPSIMPVLASLAETDAIEFTRHYSGGNSSRAGLFSIFYGLPPAYFDTFAGSQRPPVLIQEIQKQAYQLGIFSSSDMYRPAELDRTAFASVPNLSKTIGEKTEPHWNRVRILNREWLQWVARLNTDQPFFGFLYYDSTKLGPGYVPSSDRS